MSDNTKTHPSFGLLQFNRVSRSGKTKLFGSSFNQHPTSIRLSLSECEVERKHGTRYYFPRKKIYEVEISASQFAELLTTMNYGAGVPATILSREGELVEPPPEDLKREDEQVRDDFRKDMEDLGEGLREALGDYEDILTQSGRIKKADREKVLKGVRKFLQQVEKNIPYMMEAYGEAADKVEASAKAEVDAFMTHAITVAGIKTLKAEGLELEDEAKLIDLDSEED